MSTLETAVRTGAQRRVEADRAGAERRLRPVARLAAVASAGMGMAFVGSLWTGVPLRDPDGILFRRPALVLAFIAVCWLLDVLPRALGRRQGHGPLATVRAIARERWSARRVVVVFTAVLSFYVAYFAYRNVKSYIPFVREELFDARLGAIDRAVAFGHEPASLLHAVLGTGVAAYALSLVYLFFLLFVPLSLGAMLVWSRDLTRGLLYTATLTFNWILGAAGYYLLPSLGPAFVDPKAFAALQGSPAAALQQTLLHDRTAVLADPATAAVQSIAAFPSLHISIIFSAVLVSYLVGLGRRIRITLWVYLGVTAITTIYFGWHYLVDDVAGLVLGGACVGLAWLLVGDAPVMPLRRSLTVPNVVTLLRIALVPVLVLLLVQEQWVAAALVFGVGAASDCIDGRLARSRGLVTDLGKSLDPLADKLLVGGALVCLASVGRLPAWVVVAILAREVAVTTLRAVAGRRGLSVPASPLAKLKTAVQIMVVLLACLAPDPGAAWVLVAVYAALAVTVASAFDYVLHLGRRAQARAVHA